MNGLFITFEGLEGAGKSTQARILYDKLVEEGYPCLLTSEPGGTPLGNAVRDILADNAYKDMIPLTELYLFSAARAQLVEKIIRPSIEEGKIVICDRFYDATLAYQGFGRGIPESLIRETNSRASWNVNPDITIYMDIDPAVGLTRVSKRIQELEVPAHRIEKERLEFFQKVREGYFYLTREEPTRFRIINGESDSREISAAIFDLINKELMKIKFKRELSLEVPRDIQI